MLQATGCDQSVGYGMMGFAGFVFTYYTLWVIILVRYTQLSCYARGHMLATV